MSDVDVDLLQLEDADRVLLCSDGLTDCVDDDTIAKALMASALPSREACAELLQLALDGGGRDNVTVIVARHSDRRRKKPVRSDHGVC